MYLRCVNIFMPALIRLCAYAGIYDFVCLYTDLKKAGRQDTPPIVFVL